MRSLWLASAALLLGTGIACAQTPPPAPQPGPNAGSPMAPPPPHGGMGSGMGMRGGPLPANAPPDVYLRLAKGALAHRNAGRADDALSRAETRLLTRTVTQGPSIPTDQSPAVTAIDQARAALRAHDFAGARRYTDAALQALGAPPPPPPGSAPPPPAQ